MNKSFDHGSWDLFHSESSLRFKTLSKLTNIDSFILQKDFFCSLDQANIVKKLIPRYFLNFKMTVNHFIEIKRILS